MALPVGKKRKKAAQSEVVRPSEEQIRDAEEKALKSAEKDLAAAMEGETIKSEPLDLPLPSVVPTEFDETRKVEDMPVEETKPAPVRSVLSEDEPQDLFAEFDSKNR